jgi:hypothetical protein
VIAASGLLVGVAFITLIIGVFRTGLGLIWVSIAASILAAIFLALGVVAGNKRRVVTAGGPSTPAWGEDSMGTAVMEREVAVPGGRSAAEETSPSLTVVPGRDEAEAEEEEEEAPAPSRMPARAAAKPAASKPAARVATQAGSVVVIPDRDKYHLESCRYAKNPAAMSMTKAAARRAGYKACGTCKP